MKSLARALVLKGKITTTEARAKELRPFIEKLITRGKKGDVASIRYLNRYFDTIAVSKLSKEIAPRYQERPGGYTRIFKLSPRRGDGANVAIIEFV